MEVFMFLNDTNYFDQHFLIDKDIISKYLSYPHFTKEDIVVEIGPGKGILTKKIAPKVKKLYAIEIDKRLQNDLNTIPNVEMIWENVLDISIPKCDKIITSLPYSIIEPFISKLIKTDFKELYMLMGSNYITSVINKEITKLSVITNCYFEMEILLEVKPNAFDIPPRTNSYIVKMVKRKEPINYKYAIYEELNRRDHQKIKNSLMEAFIKLEHLTKKEAKKRVLDLNLPEYILIDKFETLSNHHLEILDDKLESNLINLV